jgi:hypothetical protein
VHWLARLSADEVARPARFCWGFRAALSDQAAAAANSTMPIHILPDVHQFELSMIPGSSRNKYRKCRRLARIGRLRDPGWLEAQGYDVVVSACRRTGHINPPSPSQYETNLEQYATDPRRVILAGIVDGRLAGYVTGYAVETVAYMENLYIHSDFLPTHVGTGLYLDFIEICRRCPEICTVVGGLHSIENTNLCRFKERMGFSVCQVPTIAWIARPVAWLLRWRYPHKFYRLTGIPQASRRETCPQDPGLS